MIAKKLKTLMMMKTMLLAYTAMATFLDRNAERRGPHFGNVISGVIASVRMSTE